MEETKYDEEEFYILEENVERLEKKIGKIKNKCNKYGCEFSYEQVGDEYRTNEATKETYHYIKVKAKGIAKINNWRFIASIDNVNGNNIIRKIGNDTEVPERYWDTPIVCEHCKVNRTRKYAYIIQNTETGEYKEVGKSCLCDYTHGLSAEDVARYISMFDEMIEGDEPYTGCSYTAYMERNYVLSIAKNIVNYFGYVKSGEMESTKCIVNDIYYYDRLWEHRKEAIDWYLEKCNKSKYDIGTDDVSEYLDWLEKQDTTSTYIHDLKIILSGEYIRQKDVGFAVSLIPSYNKAMEIETRKKKEYVDDSISEYVGNVGDRITIDSPEIKCISSWETEFGVTFLYKIKDENGNVYIWKSSNGCNTDNVGELKGTVKEHSEYNGIKQTVLTRCRVK